MYNEDKIISGWTAYWAHSGEGPCTINTGGEGSKHRFCSLWGRCTADSCYFLSLDGASDIRLHVKKYIVCSLGNLCIVMFSTFLVSYNGSGSVITRLSVVK